MGSKTEFSMPTFMQVNGLYRQDHRQQEDAPVNGRVVIIAGPPCAGKSTMARELAKPGDLVLDRDEMAQRLGSPRRWMHEYRYGVAAEAWMRRELRRLAWGVDGTAYVVRCLGREPERRQLADMLNADVRLLDPGEDECVRRAVVDRRPHGTIEGIRRWYGQFDTSSRPKLTHRR